VVLNGSGVGLDLENSMKNPNFFPRKCNYAIVVKSRILNKIVLVTFNPLLARLLSFPSKDICSDVFPKLHSIFA
jgi:hypothetical protein